MPDPSVSAAAASERPLVSVIIAAYCAERYLDEALQSARAQTLTDIEILVVDDGSSDDTAAIATRHGLEDPRVRLIRQEHLGTSAARNRGLAEARAQLVALLDADDVLLPTRLERQWSYLEANPDVSLLGTYGWHIGSTGHRLGVFEAGPRTRLEARQMRDRGEVIYLLASSVLMRRDVIAELGGFRAGLATAEDVELWTRVADHHLVLAMPERLVLYRVHPTSNSAGLFFEQQEMQLLIRENAALRRSGRPEMTLEQLRASLDREPWIRRLSRHRRWRSRYWYRRAGGALAARAVGGIPWLLGALVLAPDVVIPRLWRQVAPLRPDDLGRYPVSAVSLTAPLVTIGIPVYNGERFLRACLESIRQQTFRDFEVTVSDNASTDRTESICLEFAAADRRFHYVRQSTNVGLTANFNSLVSMARSPLFKWMAADDVIRPRFLECCVSLLEGQPRHVLATARVRIIDASGDPLGDSGPAHRGPNDDIIPNPISIGGEMASTDPVERFRHLLFTPNQSDWHACYYALIRTPILRNTHLHAPYVGADKVLIGELALHGSFVESDDELLEWRLHAGQVSAWAAAEIARTYRPGSGGRFQLWRLHQLFGYARAIITSPVPLSTKLQCGLAVAKRGVRGIVARWRPPRPRSIRAS